MVITTWSPGARPVTSEPTSSMIPAPSWPMTTGGGNGMVPSMTDRSLWHTPAETMRTFTSVGAVSRTSTSVATAAVLPSNTMALICAPRGWWI